MNLIESKDLNGLVVEYFPEGMIGTGWYKPKQVRDLPHTKRITKVAKLKNFVTDIKHAAKGKFPDTMPAKRYYRSAVQVQRSVDPTISGLTVHVFKGYIQFVLYRPHDKIELYIRRDDILDPLVLHGDLNNYDIGKEDSAKAKEIICEIFNDLFLKLSLFEQANPNGI